MHTHRIILGSSLIQLGGGEEQRDEGHTCHCSPNGDASWETQLVSKFGCSWVIVSSQPRMASGLAATLAIYICNIHFNLKARAPLLMLFSSTAVYTAAVTTHGPLQLLGDMH